MIKRIFKKFLLLFFLLELSACKWFGSSSGPFLKWSNITIPDGTPTFQQGFKDGCSTTLYSRGNVWYRTRYGYRYDPKLIGSSEYRLGHQRGYTWCFEHIVGSQQSFDRYLLPSGNNSVFDMTAGDINNAWGGDYGFFGNGIWKESLTTPGNGFDDTIGVWKGAMSGDIFRAGGLKGQFFGSADK